MLQLPSTKTVWCPSENRDTIWKIHRKQACVTRLIHTLHKSRGIVPLLRLSWRLTHSEMLHMRKALTSFSKGWCVTRKIHFYIPVKAEGKSKQAFQTTRCYFLFIYCQIEHLMSNDPVRCQQWSQNLVGQTINQINAPKITLTKSRCSFYVWHIYLNFKVIYFDKLLWSRLAKSK